LSPKREVAPLLPLLTGAAPSALAFPSSVATYPPAADKSYKIDFPAHWTRVVMIFHEPIDHAIFMEDVLA
jgi:hypothetical protein